jgi:CcmD family protein
MLSATLAAVVPHHAWAQQPGKPAPAQEGFQPIENFPVDEQLPAARFVMTAYAVAWLVVFGYLYSIWRRLGRVEQEIAAIGRRVEAGARR